VGLVQAGWRRPTTTPKSAKLDCFCGWGQIIDIDRALVHIQADLSSTARIARHSSWCKDRRNHYQEGTKIEIPYHCLQFGSHSMKSAVWFSVKKCSVWLKNTEPVHQTFILVRCNSGWTINIPVGSTERF